MYLILLIRCLCFKEVFHSVQGSNKSLTDQLSSASSRNETLQSELNSEMACIRRLEEEKRILKKELENVKDNNQELQQQIGHIKMTREGKKFTDFFHNKTVNSFDLHYTHLMIAYFIYSKIFCHL